MKKEKKKEVKYVNPKNWRGLVLVLLVTRTKNKNEETMEKIRRVWN